MITGLAIGTAILRKICTDNGMLWKADDCFAYMNELPEKYPQMSIFDLTGENDGS